MTYRSASCNIKGPGTAANNKLTIQKAAANSDAVSFQEGQEATSHTVISQLPGFEAYLPSGLPGANPIAWRTNKLRLFDDPGWTKIYSNKAGISDGPDRSMTWAPLEEIATKRKVIEVDVHMIHQAWTSHHERQPGWLDSIRLVAAGCNMLLEKYPDVPLVIKGDWNRGGTWEIPSLLETELQTPPTFGGARYDRFFLAGKVQGSDPRDFDTPSDHDLLVVDITILPQFVLKTMDVIVDEVLAGKWGNGDDRKKRLTLAGYDYVAVQAAVTKRVNTPPPPPTKVEVWRAAVDAANHLPFPTIQEDAAAVAMKTAVNAALKAGPKK